MKYVIIAGERLHDINVGISDDSPLLADLTPGNYSMCHHFAGAAGTETKITCDSNRLGRHIGKYVIIQIVSSPGVVDILTLCEVSVYAG